VGGTILLVGLGVILVIGLLSSIIKNGLGLKAGSKGGKGSSTPRHFSFFALRRVAKDYGLNNDQTKVLEYVLKSNGVVDPERTVENPTVLDKHFKRAFKQIERAAGSEEEAQQKLAVLFSVRNTIDVRHNTSPGAPATQSLSSGMAAVLSVNQDSFPVKVISSKTDRVVVECPRSAVGSVIKFPRGTKVNLAFFTKNSKGFSFDSQVIDKADTSYGPALHLTRNRQAKAMTQRRFRRKQAILNCDFFMVHLEDTKSKKPRMVVENRRMKGSITDISIGGLAMKTQYPLSAGSRLKIELDYSSNAPPVAVLGQILRINRSGIANTVIHVKFLKVPRKAMNAINSLVFEYGD
jgi:c-di-GMP-binding flagellar brake protein YcgR